MKYLNTIIACILILSSCTNNKMENKAGNKTDSIPIPEIQLTISDNDTVELKSNKNHWSKTFDLTQVKSSHIMNQCIIPNFRIDCKNQILYFTYFGDYLYKLDLNSGTVLAKTDMRDDLVEFCTILRKAEIDVKDQYIIIHYPKQLLLYDNKLNLITNFSKALENEEFKRLDLTRNDSLLFEKMSRSNSVLLSDKYYLDTITYTIDSAVYVKFQFKNMDSSADTTLIIKQNLKENTISLGT